MHQMLMAMMMYKNNDNSSKANSNNSNNAASSSSGDTKNNNNVSSSRRDSIVEFASMDASGLSFAKLLKKDGTEEAEDWGLSEMGMTISSDMFSVVGTKDGAPLPLAMEASMRVGGGGGGGVSAGLNTLVDRYDVISPPRNDVAAAVTAPHGKNSLTPSDTPSGTGGGGGMGGNRPTWLQQHQQRQEGTPFSTASTTPRTPKNFSMDENAFNESFKSMDMEDRPSSRKWTPTRTAVCGGGTATRGEQLPRDRPDPDGVMGGAFNSATANRARSTSRNKPYRRGTVDSMESLNLGDLMQSSGGILVDSSMGNIHNTPSNLDLGLSLTSLMSFQSVKSEKNDDKSSYWLNQYKTIDSIVFEGGDNQQNNPWEEDEDEAAAIVVAEDFIEKRCNV